jgi:hypothetical protein
MSYKLFSAGLAAALLAGASPAGAVPVTIANPGFEVDIQGSGGFSVGSPTGWTLTGGGGWWNINASPSFWASAAPEGNQVGFLGRTGVTPTSATMSQVLAAALLPDAAYTLTGSVGHPIGFGSTLDPDTVYTVELLAGNSTLASLTGTGPEGGFSLFQLTFDSTGSGLVGQALQIRLSSSQPQTAFDNIRLDVVGGVPEPSTLLLLAAGSFGYLWRGRFGRLRAAA